MKTINQYQEDMKALMQKSTTIKAKCIAENRDPVRTEIAYKNETSWGTSRKSR